MKRTSPLRPRLPLLMALCGVSVLFQGCKVDLLGQPPRPSTHGYRAVVTVKGPGRSESFEIAYRGGDLRRSLGAGKKAKALVRKGTGPVYEVDPESRTYTQVGADRILAGLSDYPLATGFTDVAEANRRGVTDYHRESDGVFAGHACQVWRFDDVPGADLSPTTTFWVAPSLDSLVVRRDRSERKPDGTEVSSVIELTSVRPGADPGLFAPPDGYRRAEGGIGGS